MRDGLVYPRDHRVQRTTFTVSNMKPKHTFSVLVSNAVPQARAREALRVVKTGSALAYSEAMSDCL